MERHSVFDDEDDGGDRHTCQFVKCDRCGIRSASSFRLDFKVRYLGFQKEFGGHPICFLEWFLTTKTMVACVLAVYTASS